MPENIIIRALYGINNPEYPVNPVKKNIESIEAQSIKIGKMLGALIKARSKSL